MFENIVGQKRAKILNQLTGESTFVKVSLPRNEYESLTIVTWADKESSNPIFQIDPPEGLVSAIADSSTKLLHFEFTSKDRVTHNFDAEINNVSNDAVVLLFPQFIQRHQQRDNFRVKGFYGSYAKIWIDDIEIRLIIDNLSLGGVFCLCPKEHKAKFTEQQILKNLELHITLEKECFVVPIQQAQVNRFENKSIPRQFGVAFEFVRLKREAKKILVRNIYELQRQHLQNRLK